MSDHRNSTALPAISIVGVEITRDDEGRFNLNALTKAAKAQGVVKDIRPNEWLALASTFEMSEILITENPACAPIFTAAGRYGGTYVHELLAVSYAGWISPSFQLKVNQAFLDMKAGKAGIPNFADPVAAARAWADQAEARQIAERTKAEIGSRREATAMNTASQAVRRASELQKQLDAHPLVATVKRMESHYSRTFPWRPLKKAAEALGVVIEQIDDANYGKVNLYPAEIWMQVYAVEIPAAGKGGAA